ncbi:MAG TPA: alpha-galactosidase [archaeon]|nr:alpha-galactosidase [archaeon]
MQWKSLARDLSLLALAVCSGFSTCARDNSGIEFSFHPGGTIRFKNAALELEFDSRMYGTVYYLKDGARLTLCAGGPKGQPGAPTHFAVVEDQELKDFEVDYKTLDCSEVTSEFGRGKRLILRGEAEGLSGVRIEKKLTVELYEDYPDLALCRAEYRNLSSRPVKLGDIYSSAFLLSASQVDPALAPHGLHAFYGNAGRLVPQIDTELSPGYAGENYTGRTAQVEGQKRGNGGIPFIDLWCKGCGIAVGHLEPQWRNLYMPIRVGDDGRVFIGIGEDPSLNLLEPVLLEPGGSFKSVRTFVCVHEGDFYTPAARYSRLMRAQGLDMHTERSENDYLAAWCSWNRYCTSAPASKKDVMLKSRVLEKVGEQTQYGIKLIIFDAGWFNNQGDWRPNLDTLAFPGGEEELAGMIDELHAQGFKVMLWISFLTADPWSEVAAKHPEWMILKPDGTFHLDRWSGWTMCPSLPEVEQYHRELARRLILDYGADAFKVDGMYTCPPCYNPAHNHRDPNQSSRDFHKVFRAFYEEAKKIKPEVTVMDCPCGAICGFDVLPYVSQTIAADPPDCITVRRWAKLYRALKGPGTPFSSDYVQVDEGKMRLPTAVGVGAVPQSFQGEPPEPEVREWYRKWFGIYNREMLPEAKYENLYDIYYDKPETHVFRKETATGEAVYYSMYADNASWSGIVEFRGLTPGKTYRVVDYVNQSALGTVSSDKPALEVSFSDYLLVKCIPE